MIAYLADQMDHYTSRRRFDLIPDPGKSMIMTRERCPGRSLDTSPPLADVTEHHQNGMILQGTVCHNDEVHLSTSSLSIKSVLQNHHQGFHSFSYPADHQDNRVLSVTPTHTTQQGSLTTRFNGSSLQIYYIPNIASLSSQGIQTVHDALFTLTNT
jgi:hypothetical protein